MADPQAPRATFRVPPRWVLCGVAGGACLLLWTLSGWHWVPFAVAVGSILVVRVIGLGLLGAFLPRWLRQHDSAAALTAGAIALMAISSAWAVVLCLGLALAVLALIQAGRWRVIGLSIGAVLVAAGSTGLIAEHLADVARAEADAQAASDFSRGQMLPDRPDATVEELMRALPQGGQDGGLCALMFTVRGQEAFSSIYHAPSCTAALSAVRGQIRDPVRWRERLEPASLTVSAGPAGSVVVDACHVRWRADDALGELLYGSSAPALPPPGPSLGRVALVPVPGGWAIDDVRAC